MTETLERTKTYQQFIGGDFVDAADGRTAEVVNPANDQVIANVPASSHEDVDRAVNAAETAFESWKKTTPQDRSRLLLKIADALEAKADELGREDDAPLNDLIDIGVLGADDEPLFLEKRRIDREQTSFTVVVDKQPTRAGIDPYNKLIDRSPKDNTVAVSIE